MNQIREGADTVDFTCRMLNGRRQYVWFRLIGTVVWAPDNQSIVYCSFFDIDLQRKTQLALEKDQAILELAMQTAKMHS